MSDEKNMEKPLNNEGKTNEQGQPVYYNPYYPPMPPQQGEGQPVYYMPYPYYPMPSQQGEGEQGQQPMYMPMMYPPMPQQQGEGEQGQQPMYMPMMYPPMPQQQGEQGQQPMYMPMMYPPMPQQQGEQGQQPMYMPMMYPPMPQQQGEQGQQPMNMPFYPPMPPQQEAPKPSNMPFTPASPLNEDDSPKPSNMPFTPASPLNDDDSPEPSNMPFTPASPLNEDDGPEPSNMPFTPTSPLQEDEQNQGNIPYYPPVQQIENGGIINNDETVKTSFADFLNSDQKSSDNLYSNTSKNDFDSTIDIQAEPKPYIPFEIKIPEEDQNIDKTFVSTTPIYDTTNDSPIGIDKNDENSIFASTTPIIDMSEEKPQSEDTLSAFENQVYDPESLIKTEEESNTISEEEPQRPAVTANSFLASMQSFYSSMAEPKDEEEKPVTLDEETFERFEEPVKENKAFSFTSPADDLLSDEAPQDSESPSSANVENFEPSFTSASDFFEEKPEINLSSQPESEPQPKNFEPEEVKPYSIGIEKSEPEVSEQTFAEPEPINQEEKAKDRQYWDFMNQLLDRFDDTNDNSLSTVKEPVAQEPAAPMAPVKDALEESAKKLADFGKNVNKQQLENKFFKKDKPDELKLTDEYGSAILGEKEDSQEPQTVVPAAPQLPKMPKPPARPSQKKYDLTQKSKSPKKAKEKPAKKEQDLNTSKTKPTGFKAFLAAIFPMKGDSTKEIVRKVVLIVSVLVLICCIAYFINVWADKNTNIDETNHQYSLIQSDKNQNLEWSDIHKKYPNTTFPSGMLKKYASLYNINQDLVGWIKVDGLGISYPVVRGDNDTYYLKHNFNKDESIYGCIEMSSNNNIETLDLNTVIYGHTMTRDDQMFTKLSTYKTLEGYKKAPVIEMDTIYGDYTWKVYAVFITNGYGAQDNNNYVFNYVFNNLPDVKTFAQYVDQINQRTLYTTGVGIQPTDRLLTLSTCTHEFTEARLVVVARMVRIGESDSVDTSKAKTNSSPRYPQAYYTAKGVTNPYADYDQWNPFDN